MKEKNLFPSSWYLMKVHSYRKTSPVKERGKAPTWCQHLNTCWILQSAKRKYNKCHNMMFQSVQRWNRVTSAFTFLAHLSLTFHKHSAQQELWISALMNRWRIRTLHLSAALLICWSHSFLLRVFDLYWIQAHLMQLLLHFCDVLSGFRTWEATSTLDLYTSNSLSSPWNSIQDFRGG